VRKVITVSLNGNAFQLEDDAYAALSAYLEEAARALASNPDRAEIISDLEQAIADKCAAFLNPHKSVLTRTEVEQVITQMGPVDGEPAASAAGAGGAQNGTAGATSADGSADPKAAPRRLYQISDGAMVSGICNGYAAYSGLDVTWIRVIFVLLIVVSGGAALIAYLVLMFIIPYASTSEEHAAAHGLPFNARLLVENAKRHYAQFAHSQDWRREKDSWRQEWRRTRAQWRLERLRAREERRRYRHYGHPPYGVYPPAPGPTSSAPPVPAPYVVHVITGSMMAILGLCLGVVGIAMCFAIFSLVTSGGVLGWQWPANLPLWLGVVAIIVTWNIAAWPLRGIRHSIAWHSGGYRAPWFAAFDAIVSFVILFALVWWSVHHWAQLQDFFQSLPRLWEHNSWSNTAAKLVVQACTTMKDWLALVSPRA
jgi:phage shock protein PspC (stress-responsive transcriptional regulator)